MTELTCRSALAAKLVGLLSSLSERGAEPFAKGPRQDCGGRAHSTLGVTSRDDELFCPRALGAKLANPRTASPGPTMNDGFNCIVTAQVSLFSTGMRFSCLEFALA